MHSKSDERPETIILVHGTRAQPKGGSSLGWYQPGHEFVRALDIHLKQMGSKARCWAHLEINGKDDLEESRNKRIYSWSGVNDWRERGEAAETLADLIIDLSGKGWRCHVIAHSHGGNILLEALKLIDARSTAAALKAKLQLKPCPKWVRGWDEANYVTLGTPFLASEHTTVALASLFPAPFKSPFIRLFSLALFSVVTILVYKAELFRFPSSLAFVAFAVGCLPGFALFIVSLLVHHFDKDPETYRNFLSPGPWIYDEDKVPRRILSIFAEADEALVLLKRVSQIENSRLEIDRDSLSLKKLLLASYAYIGKSLRIHFGNKESYGRAVLVAGIAFLVGLFLAGSATYRGAITAGAFVAGATFPLLAMQIFLRRLWVASAWSYLLAPIAVLESFLKSFVFSRLQIWARGNAVKLLKVAAFGLSAHPSPNFSVSRKPGLHKDTFELRCIDPKYEQEWVKYRNSRIGVSLDTLAKRVSDLAVGEESILLLLKEIETSPDLVHAIYYLHRDCIHQIADWVARSEDQAWDAVK